MQRFNRRHCIVAAAALLLSPLSWAESSPLPPAIKIVVPFPAGGAVDVTVRRLGEQLAKGLATTVIVENKPGASGVIGIRAAAPAAGNGSVLLYAHSGMVTAQAMGAKIDLLKEFKPVAKLSVAPHLLMVRADSPYKTQRDLIEAMKAKPGKLNFGSGGAASPTHLMYELLEGAVPGIKATHVPFKGAIDGIFALAGGEIDFQFATPAAAAELIKSGKLRALSFTGTSRTPYYPDVPTVAEAGVPGYRAEPGSGILAEPWGGLLITTKASDALVARLADAVMAAINTPEMKEVIEKSGSRKADRRTPAEFAQDIQQELTEQRALIKKLGMVAE